MVVHKGNCNYLYHTVNSCKLSHTWACVLFLCFLRIHPSELTELFAPEFGSQALLIECSISVLGLWGFPLKIPLAAFSSLPYSYSVAMWCKVQGQAISPWAFMATPLLWPRVSSKWMRKECGSTFLILLACFGDLAEPWWVMWYLMSAAPLHLLTLSEETIKNEAKQSWNDNKFRVYAHLSSHILNCSFMFQKPLRFAEVKSRRTECCWSIPMGRGYYPTSLQNQC